MSAKKHISLILLLCFTILLGHNLVPHHHHAEILPGAINTDCPIEHEDHHDSDDHPFHCHAFNNVDFFKINHLDIQKKPGVILIRTISVSKTDLVPSADVESYRYVRLKIPDESAACYGAISLRAPPAFI
ncbi:MAG: hypothetical protein KAR19_05690 [Bacteroidales bacterium]|nr:hypothetical protein [Bacteroidales bacterium]